MANLINLQPEILDLKLYAGDGVKLKMTCKDGAGAPVDLTGTVEAQVRLQPITDDPFIIEFASNLVDAYLGIVILTLTGEQTQELSDHPSSVEGKFTGVWDVEWTASEAEPRTLCQGRVECVSDVTR